MRPRIATKKKPAKRNDNPIIEKLLKLKYRLNDWYREFGEDTSDDKECDDEAVKIREVYIQMYL